MSSMSSEFPTKHIEKDCFPCRVTGTLSCAAIGAFIFYTTATSKYYVKRPYVQMAVQSVGVVFLYGSLARWFYFPPFRSLRPRRKEAN
ncbi:hypothetical protein GCK32_016540 [Trichostrongylus colubriformis]|uniref:DUF4536 domain-containing protein n=1 Tax=Trichostrongylus colubriformis TaxID=6319 RepID=A0AAN8IIE9_TRICO